MTKQRRTIPTLALLGLLLPLAAVPAGAAAGPSIDVLRASAERPAAADLAGEWHGALAVGGQKLRLVFHLETAQDGSLTATIDSPDQGAYGIPVASAALEDGVLTLDVAALRAVYEGRVSDDRRSIDGEWRQSDRALPLEVERAAASGDE